VIATEWNEFRAPDFDRVAAQMPSKLIFDGRNLYRTSQMAERGFAYHSIGRSPVLPRG
jgi:UDPglucose 6-dehydrogenase